MIPVARRTGRLPLGAMFGLGLCVGLAGSGAWGVAAYHHGRDAGRLDAYRETDRVLRDLEYALAPLVQGHVGQGQGQATHDRRTIGDTP